MAAHWCRHCKVGWGTFVDVCRICDGPVVYQKDMPPSTSPEFKKAEERFLKDLERFADVGRTDPIVNWRFECLLDAGAPPEVAELVASWKVDLHRACRMFRRGCDPQLAQLLLSPVD